MNVSTQPEIHRPHGEQSTPQVQLATFECGSCGQRSWVPIRFSDQQGRCAWCASALIVRVGAATFGGDRLKPLPFEVGREAARERLRSAVKEVPSACAELNASQLAARLRQVYLPVWVARSCAKGEWRAECGFAYTVLSYRERYHQQRWQTETLFTAKVDWYPRSGCLQQQVEGIEVPALATQSAIEDELGTFRTSQPELSHVDFGPGVAILEPDYCEEDRRAFADEALHAVLTERIREACQADGLRNLERTWKCSHDDWTLRLLPVWTTWYRDEDGQVTGLWLHGQTGHLAGRLMASSHRGLLRSALLLGLALILALIGCLWTATQPAIPALCMCTAFLVLIWSPWPWIDALAWRRRELAQG